jgi:ribosome assembly protein 1
MQPMQAYSHLTRLIEHVNAIIGDLFAGERMDDDFRWREERERQKALKNDLLVDEPIDPVDEFMEKDDDSRYFSPDRGNVVFASAIDGWGFRVGNFAKIYSAKLGMKEANLRRVLWGDFFLDPKTKKVISQKHLRGRVLKPLFVQFILENIWAVYYAVVVKPCVPLSKIHLAHNARSGMLKRQLR